jgi:hypothetical protein
LPCGGAFIGPAGLPIGSQRLGLQAKQPGDDSEAQGIRTNSGMVIVGAFGGRKRVGQARDDGILGVPGCGNVPYAFHSAGIIGNSLAGIAILSPCGFCAHGPGIRYRVGLGGMAVTGPLSHNGEHKVEVSKSQQHPAFDNGMAGRRRSRFMQATQIGGNRIGIGCTSAERRPPIDRCTIYGITVVVS